MILPPDKAFYSPEELGELLGVPAATVHQWRWKGTGPRGTKVGRHLRFSRQAIEAWIEANSDPA